MTDFGLIIGILANTNKTVENRWCYSKLLQQITRLKQTKEFQRILFYETLLLAQRFVLIMIKNILIE